jgi:hypothetical protein
MTCQEFWNTMPEPGASAPGRHLLECAACAARMERQRELAAGLRAMAAGYQRVGAPQRVEARLRAAFRAQAGVRSKGRWAPVLGWAAACAAVMAMAVYLIRDRQPQEVPPPAPRGLEMAMMAGGEDAQGDYEGFIALPNAGRLAENEEVNLVRVEVPRSAMIAVGLEVSPERVSELVAADVMVGPDGLARAVRFLDSDSLF